MGGQEIGGLNFTKEQLDNYKLAQIYGKEIGYEKELIGIMYAESTGKKINVGDQVNKKFKRSYGLMQVKLDTYYWAKKTGYVYPLDDEYSLTEEEVLVHLISDKNFNVYVAAGVLKMMKGLCKTDEKAISGYNRGHCDEDAKGKDYRSKVKYFMDFIDKNNFLAVLDEIPMPATTTIMDEYADRKIASKKTKTTSDKKTKKSDKGTKEQELFVTQNKKSNKKTSEIEYNTIKLAGRKNNDNFSQNNSNTYSDGFYVVNINENLTFFPEYTYVKKEHINDADVKKTSSDGFISSDRNSISHQGGFYKAKDVYNNYNFNKQYLQ